MSSLLVEMDYISTKFLNSITYTWSNANATNAIAIATATDDNKMYHKIIHMHMHTYMLGKALSQRCISVNTILDN